MNNQVFAQVMNTLAERRRQNEREEERRRAEVIAKCPEIGQVMDTRREAVMKSVYSAFALPAEEDLPQKVEAWNARIRQLLVDNGYPENYLEPVFQCAFCEDTGYVGTGKKQLCTCAKALYAALLEQDSSFKEEETFETFDPRRFPETALDAGGETQRGRMLKFRDYCERYADSLPHPEKKNLLLYGGSGLGKTFLLRCIHARARQRDIPALCLTANQLIRIARKAIFDRAAEACEKILNEHADQLRAIAEYLLVHETMEGEEFEYFFEHGEFMPESVKQAKLARMDRTIERPARKISMTGEKPEPAPAAETQQPASEQAEAPAEKTETEGPAESGEEAPSAEEKQDE